MKKLTALLLGTVISIAFTASNAFAGAGNEVMNYWNSNDGRTGGYFGITGLRGSVDEVSAAYLRQAPDQSWNLEDAFGGQVQYGFDFGKIRTDLRFGVLESQVGSINGEGLEANTSDDAILAYTTVNLDWDIYRFELINQDFVNIAITPYIGGGIGYGGGWMTGKKDSDSAIGGDNTKRDAAGHGVAYSFEAGTLINVTDWAGITLGYTYLDLELQDTGDDGTRAKSHLGTIGVRFTY